MLVSHWRVHLKVTHNFEPIIWNVTARRCCHKSYQMFPYRWGIERAKQPCGFWLHSNNCDIYLFIYYFGRCAGTKCHKICWTSKLSSWSANMAVGVEPTMRPASFRDPSVIIRCDANSPPSRPWPKRINVDSAVVYTVNWLNRHGRQPVESWTTRTTAGAAAPSPFRRPVNNNNNTIARRLRTIQRWPEPSTSSAPISLRWYANWTKKASAVRPVRFQLPSVNCSNKCGCRHSITINIFIIIITAIIIIAIITSINISIRSIWVNIIITLIIIITTRRPPHHHHRRRCRRRL